MARITVKKRLYLIFCVESDASFLFFVQLSGPMRDESHLPHEFINAYVSKIDQSGGCLARFFAQVSIERLGVQSLVRLCFFVGFSQRNVMRFLAVGNRPKNSTLMVRMSG